LLFALSSEGFAAQRVALAGEALALLRRGGIDLVILDVGLPDMTGFELCKQLRQFSTVPVMFLTARAEEIDRVVGLEIGADDYVVKPFSPREVVARVRAILKRTTAAPAVPISNAEFHVDHERLQIHCSGRLLKLTALEYRLLAQLVGAPGRVHSREQLLEGVGMPAAVGYERNIDSHIKALRAKLREVAPEREPIQTHRGFGYSYQPPDAGRA
jgi:two-component system, OmpR family, catabolic regulation response regulator CreB